MTTTKTLIEAATLTEEEKLIVRERVELRSNHVPGRMAFESEVEDVIATAARDKAFWAVVDWLKERSPAYRRGEQYTIVGALVAELTAWGIERPTT